MTDTNKAIQLRLNPADKVFFDFISQHLKDTLPSTIEVTPSLIMREALRRAAVQIEEDPKG